MKRSEDSWRFCVIVGLVLTIGRFSTSADEAVELFNGRDLSGWTLWVGEKDRPGTEPIFSVTNGMIHAYASAKAGSRQPFAGLVTTNTYSRYVLKVEYRWGETKFAPRADFVRDAGVLFHVHGPERIWPSSVECQIQEGDTGDIWAIDTQVTSTVQPTIRNFAPAPGGKPETRGDKSRGFARFHRSYCHEVPGWNLLVLTVDGDRASYRVNGELVNEANAMKRWDEAAQAWRPLTNGFILLQAEGAEVFYRNVRLAPLPAPSRPDKN
jgi:hypothetical protein